MQRVNHTKTIKLLVDKKSFSGCILVYDVTKTNSFQKLETWIEELELNTNQNIAKMVVGNKIDLPNRTVDREMGKKFAKQQRGMICNV